MVVVEVRDPDGTLVKRVTANEEQFKLAQGLVSESGNDLLTLWIYRIIRGLLTPVPSGHNVSEPFTDITGTSRSPMLKRVSDTLGAFWNTNICANRPWIAYGSSSAPPTRTDFRLGSKLGEAPTIMTHDESARTITFTAGWTLTADITIYEVGLEWEGAVLGHNVCGRFLVDRTVFPGGIPVRAGQTLTISYVVSVP
jgi:hypothetical protein